MLMMLARSGIGRLVLRLMLDRRVPIWTKLIIPAAIAYMASPIDILPDIVPLLGWLDDIAAIIVSVTLFLMAVPRDVLREHSGGPQAPPRGADPNSRGPVIDGKARVVDVDDAPDPDDAPNPKPSP